MSILIGASWNCKNKIDSLYRGNKFSYNNLKELYSQFTANRIIDKEISNFRRISTNSKLYSLLTGLSIYDSRVDLSSLKTENFGVISCTHKASNMENMKYFNDYISAGRKMARGNLFVYTLPTSSLGEVAITYQLRGPLFYSNFTDNRMDMFLEQADFMIKTEQAEYLACIYTDTLSEICLIITKEANHCKNRILEIETIKDKLKKNSTTIELIQLLQIL